jgi:prolipoprotein diacylglyceryl transferase
MQYFYKNEGKPTADADKLAIYVVIGTIIGARLGHCFFYDPAYYLSNPIEIFKVWHGGLASHGGAIGILLAIWIYTKRLKDYNFLWVVDRVVIVVALGGLFIRTGNFFNSEIIGKITDIPWAVIFPSVDMFPRHPSMLYEAITYFVIFLLLLFIYRKTNAHFNSGLLFGLFLLLVFSARFLLEFTKEYQEAFEAALPIDMGQILSIPFILLGIVMLIYSQRKHIK